MAFSTGTTGHQLVAELIKAISPYDLVSDAIIDNYGFYRVLRNAMRHRGNLCEPTSVAKNGLIPHKLLFTLYPTQANKFVSPL